MPSRRAFLHLAIGGTALIPLTTGQIWASRLATVGGSEGPDDLCKFVFDERFDASVAAARRHERRGVAVYGIRGDVTALWYHDLYHRWKRGPAPLAGVTTHESLFCLDVLARDAGLRVVNRRDEAGLVSWVIAPVRRV
jgi:hypothetical protein